MQPLQQFLAHVVQWVLILLIDALKEQIPLATLAA
jgi:hypothetical protein